MTSLNETQMREIEGEGFWEGFLCGAAVGLAVGMMVSPEPFSKLLITSAWGTAAGTCGVAFS